LNFLDEAIENGAEIIYKALVEKVLVENGKAKGILLNGTDSQKEIMADTVILAAGGYGTPLILQNSGFEEAGSNFFIDPFITTYGIAGDLNQANEPVMALIDHEFYESKRFILSTFINQSRMGRFLDTGIKGMMTPSSGLIGVMTKISDEPSGRIYPDGTFSKPVTEKDREKFNEGIAICREILIKAGADSKSIKSTKVQGSHPGGTAAIGSIVDNNLQTKADNLFVCDASVFPTSSGKPPILTIAALAKRLAKTLVP
jgi:choline dehydrogenase-like flavoprotein